MRANSCITESTEGVTIQLDPSLAGSSSSLSAAYINSVLPGLLDHYGLDLQSVLEEAGVDPRVLETPDALVPLLDVMRLFMVVLQHTRDRGLGFEMGRRVKARSYQVLGYVVLSSGTLREAIHRLLRFEKLAGNLGHTEMEQPDSGLVRLKWFCPISGAPAVHVREAAVTGWVAFARQLSERQHHPVRVCFTHAAPPDTARYEEFFQCPVCFEADFDGVELDSSLLDIPLDSADPVLNLLMEREAVTLLSDYDSSTNLVNAVRSQIYQLLVEGEPTVEVVAERMGLAARTLRGRLRRQGVGFQELVDGLRRSLAEIYLEDPRLSLTDIALLLGFSEQSSFTRAFRRWRGESPAAFRRR